MCLLLFCGLLDLDRDTEVDVVSITVFSHCLAGEQVVDVEGVSVDCLLCRCLLPLLLSVIAIDSHIELYQERGWEGRTLVRSDNLCLKRSTFSFVDKETVGIKDER